MFIKLSLLLVSCILKDSVPNVAANINELMRKRLKSQCGATELISIEETKFEKKIKHKIA